MLNGAMEDDISEIIQLIYDFTQTSKHFDYEQQVTLLKEGILTNPAVKQHIWMRRLILESVEDFKTLFDSFLDHISQLLCTAIDVDSIDDIYACIQCLVLFSTEWEMKAAILSSKTITDCCVLMVLTNKFSHIASWIPFINWKVVCKDTAILDQILEIVFDNFVTFGNEIMPELTKVLQSNKKALERFLDNPKATLLVHKLITSLNQVDLDTLTLLSISGLLLLLTREEELMDGESAVRILKVSVAALEQVENERLQDIAATLLQVGCHKPLFASRLRRTLMGGLARKLLAMIAMSPRKPLVDLAQTIFGTTKLITSDFIPLHSIQLDPLLRWLNGYGLEALQAAKLTISLIEVGFLGDEESIKAISQEIMCILGDHEKVKLFGALDRASNALYGCSITASLMRLLQTCQSLMPQILISTFVESIYANWGSDICWMKRNAVASQLVVFDKANQELNLWLKLASPFDRDGFNGLRRKLYSLHRQHARDIQIQQSSVGLEERHKLAQIEFQSRVDGLESVVRLKDEEMCRMNRQILLKDGELLEQANMISQLQLRITAETINSQETQCMIEKCEEQVQQLTAELEESKSKLASIEAQARDQIGDFLLKIESQSMEIQDLKESNGALDESNALMEADLLLSKGEIDDLKIQLERANEYVVGMTNSSATEKENLVQQHSGEISALRSQLAELSNKVYTFQELIASQKDELTCLRLGEGQLRLQIDSLRVQIDEKDGQIREDRDEISRLSKALYT